MYQLYLFNLPSLFKDNILAHVLLNHIMLKQMCKQPFWYIYKALQSAKKQWIQHNLSILWYLMEPCAYVYDMQWGLF